MPTSHVLRLGTRGSLLARTQSQQVANAVMAASPGVRVELIVLGTTGDRVQDRPLADLGGKGLFTKELELALLEKRVDFAVHSYKDVPVTMPLVDGRELTIGCVPARADVRDVLIARTAGTDVARLPLSAKVGTGSLRRRCLLLDRRPDLRIEGVRGNIDTRLRKLAAGEFDAIVLAMAGLERAGLFDARTMTPVDVEAMPPSPGQGALAIQSRRDDVSTHDSLRPLHDEAVAACVAAERDIVRGLHGDCHSPIAAYATLDGGRMTLRAAVGATDGNLPVRRATATGDAGDPAAIVGRVLAGLADEPK